LEIRSDEPLEVKVARMEEKIENIETAVYRIEKALTSAQQSFVTQKEMEFRDKQIEKLENNQTWLWRTVLGSVIGGGIGILFLAFQVFMKGVGT